LKNALWRRNESIEAAHAVICNQVIEPRKTEALLAAMHDLLKPGRRACRSGALTAGQIDRISCASARRGRAALDVGPS
jgi:hypothetical protein